jgi:hypothetical protein
LLRCPRFKERCEAEFRSLFHSDKAVIWDFDMRRLWSVRLRRNCR